jgi:hypothetical protein
MTVDRMVVRLLSDPGVATAIGRDLADGLPALLARSLGDSVRWQVETISHSVTLDDHGVVPMARLADQFRRADHEVLVVLTDLPRRVDVNPVLSAVDPDHGVGLISIPALGTVRPRSRGRDVLVWIVQRLTEKPLPPRSFDPTRVTRVLDRLVAPVRRVERAAAGSAGERLELVGVRGRLRLLSGMVWANQPWRLVPHLSSATAAAAATAAYGILTTTFWRLADALPAWRLMLIMVMAVGAMVVWLITYNHLWDLPSDADERRKAAIYNVSTAITLTFGVTCMYVILFVLGLAAALVAIEPDYLRSQLGHPVGFVDYAKLVWLTSSVGIAAGALGSSLESEDAVRRATYSEREIQRRARGRSSGD